MKDFVLTVKNERIIFEIESSKKLEIAEVLAQFLRENKGVAAYLTTCVELSKQA